MNQKCYEELGIIWKEKEKMAASARKGGGKANDAVKGKADYSPTTSPPHTFTAEISIISS